MWNFFWLFGCHCSLWHFNFGSFLHVVARFGELTLNKFSSSGGGGGASGCIGRGSVSGIGTERETARPPDAALALVALLRVDDVDSDVDVVCRMANKCLLSTQTHARTHRHLVVHARLRCMHK